ncbi:hypothetical protein [Egicoccus halophilus]|uniref:DUF3153 domain-containing protein n=1 Tax=Egicoccus halophilus TaxID=1670830 RepID=A0A8J3ET58_9ACTN|nr:hypothetical protein [Egicoccus halophilus]GGI08833.1 hypothetical protein GCM10011354_31060 [Egicoccus halophilus]
MPAPGPRRVLRSLLPLLLVVLVAAGCRIDVTGQLVVQRDGSGTAGLELYLDPDAVAELDALAVDPFAELSAVAVEVDDWQVERTLTDDGGERVRLATRAVDPQALTDALRELSSGLSDGDPALLIDLDLTVDAVGATTLDGVAGLRPPATAGARQDGEPLGPSGDELAALVDDAVRARLVVTLPGAVAEHDAEQVTGGSWLGLTGVARTLHWELPVGEPRLVTARADAPAVLAPPVVAGLAVAGVLLLGVVGWWWRRRRRRRR